MKKGQLLFKISNPMYEQEVLSAKASIERFQAAVNTARMNYKKTVPLVEKGIISEYELEAKDLDLKGKQAELEEAKARLRNAKVNLSYTSIFSPSNGIIPLLNFLKLN
ncbi:Multidrug resistance protein MdtE precursor [Mycobacterium tuberculosis]|nr:Multidrug resistance protein MdtE precursor [Mycobacterium tuberculosis]